MNTKRQAATIMGDPAGASPRQLARIAGGLYLLNIVAGFFAIGVVPALLFVEGDVAATLHHIQADELPYRDRESTPLNSSHAHISSAVFCFKKKKSTTDCERSPP